MFVSSYFLGVFYSEGDWTYEGARVRSIETEHLDRRCGVGGRSRIGVASSGSNGHTWNCHTGSPSCDATGEHCGGVMRGEWVVVRCRATMRQVEAWFAGSSEETAENWPDFSELWNRLHDMLLVFVKQL